MPRNKINHVKCSIKSPKGRKRGENRVIKTVTNTVAMTPTAPMITRSTGGPTAPDGRQRVSEWT